MEKGHDVVPTLDFEDRHSELYLNFEQSILVSKKVFGHCVHPVAIFISEINHKMFLLTRYIDGKL